MRHDIYDAVKAADSYEKFLFLIREKGYEVKGDSLCDNALKYISFRAPGQQRFVRGSDRSLGHEYTRDSIIRRINEREKNGQRRIKAVRAHNPDIFKRTATKKSLLDTSGERFKNSPGLTHWANIQNLKTTAANYAEVGNLTELRKKIDDKAREAGSAGTELAVIGKQLKELKEIQHYLTDYKDNRPFKIRYEKSKDPDRYFRMHEMQLILFDGAKNWLQKMGIRPNITELDQVNSDIKALESKESELEKKRNEARKAVRIWSRNTGISQNIWGLIKMNRILTIQKRKGRRKIAGSGSWNRYELLILGYSSGSFPMSLQQGTPALSTGFPDFYCFISLNLPFQ